MQSPVNGMQWNVNNYSLAFPAATRSTFLKQRGFFGQRKKKEAMTHLPTSTEHLPLLRSASNTNCSEADGEGETDVEAARLITRQHGPTPCPSPSRQLQSVLCACV